jgi:hypothetical protein
MFIWIGSQSTNEEKAKAMEFAQRYVAEIDDGRDVDIPIIRVNAGQEPSMFSCHFVGWDSEFTKKHSFQDPYQAKLDAMAAEKAKGGSGSAASTPAKAASVASTPAKASSVASTPAKTPGASGAGSTSPLKPVASSSAAAKSSPAQAAPAPSSAAPGAAGGGNHIDPSKKKFPYDQLKDVCPEGVDPTQKEAYLDDKTFQETFGMDRHAFNGLAKWKRDAEKKKHGLF